MFTFRFKLISTHDGFRRNYTLDKNCPLSLPWAFREVSCESNYMEVRLNRIEKMFLDLLLIISRQVSIITDVTYPTATKSEEWDSAFDTVRASVCFVSFFQKTRACSYFEISPGLFLSQLCVAVNV